LEPDAAWTAGGKRARISDAGLFFGGHMRVIVNGESVECAAGTSLHGLIVQLGFKPEAVVVERNHELAPSGSFAQIVLEQGDKIELLQFVGGG
jgi:thiamine biosynthesis protein ThiS